MNNFKILKELIKRFQGVRAVLYFAEIIGMGVADGISVVLVSRIIPAFRGRDERILGMGERREGG